MAGRDWFDATFDDGSAGALVIDREGRIERSNRAFQELLGTDDPAGRLLGEVFAAGVQPLEEAYQRVLANGQELTLTDLVLETPHRGRRRTVDVELYPRSSGRGGSSGVLMVVTDRTGPQHDPAESTRLFYQAFLHSTNAMELTDRDGFLVDVNPAFERIYGYRKEELIGRRPNVVASGRTDRSTYDRMWKALLDPAVGAWSGEVINQDRDGVDHPVLLAISAVRAPDGTITHFLGVAVDLSERRAWERAAMHSERLASLGQLGAGVAHEMNTPLANIMLIAESIRRRSKDPWTRSRVDSLLQQAESAAQIVRGLLDFARRPEAKIGEVDLGELVRSSVQFLEGKQSAGVELVLSVPVEPVLVRADREQVKQVVTNLVNNAYDALDGRGRVTVDVATVAEWAHIRVRDNGPGLPPEVQTHLFEPFITTKPEGRGTGLGLAICHGIVQSHGGEIEVVTAAGEGTTFDVRLPLVSRPDGAPGAPST